MKRKHEVVMGQNISCWENKDCFDKYTVVFLYEEYKNGSVNYLAMSENPFHPQGFCQHGEMYLSAVQYKGRGGCFDKRIKFDDLPDDCKKAVIQDLNFNN